MSTPLEVVHLDLDTRPLEIPRGSTVADKYIVFWWRGVALGHRQVAAAQVLNGDIDPLAVAVETVVPNLRAHLDDYGIALPGPETDRGDRSASESLALWQGPMEQLQRTWSTPGVDVSVSVVICTRDRPAQLEQCLASLHGLSTRPLEIVVVDNAPASEATRRLVAGLPDVRYVREPRPGLDIARNAGVHHSVGDVVAYVDDDVSVHSGWLDGLRRGFRDPAVMAVTGLVLAADLSTPSQRIFERYWSFNRGYRAVTYDAEYFARYRAFGVPSWRIGAGANMAFRRAVFARAGEFDERLDVGAAGCSGDSEYWYRVLAEGGVCRYEPTAVVFHRHRATMQGLRRQLFYYMRGHVAALLVRHERYGHRGNLVHVGLLVPYYAKLLVLGWMDGRARYTTLWQEIRGCLAGVRFYWRNRRARSG